MLQGFGVYDLMIRALILLGVLFMSFSNFFTIRKKRILNEKMNLIKYYNNYFIQHFPLFSTYVASILIGVGLLRVGSLLHVNMSSEPIMRFFSFQILSSEEILQAKVGIYFITISSAIIYVASSILLNLSQLQLGQNFSLFVDIKDEYKLIRSGLYRVIRHPIYLFELICFFSASFALLSWALFLWTLLIHLPLLILRTRAEDGILEHYFKEEFLRYKESTPSLIPIFSKHK